MCKDAADVAVRHCDVTNIEIYPEVPEYAPRLYVYTKGFDEPTRYEWNNKFNCWRMSF